MGIFIYEKYFNFFELKFPNIVNRQLVSCGFESFLGFFMQGTVDERPHEWHDAISNKMQINGWIPTH